MSERRTVTRDTLNSVMEFDHVIRVHPDGTVSDEWGVFAPELYDGKLSPDTGWTLLTGYSSQDRYSGPVMHNSESIGGGMATAILSDPGVYVAIAASWTPDDDSEDTIEGWAVARMVVA